MTPVEWFRTSDWDEAAAQDFEVRLARSRPTSRPQYLLIKGLSLARAGNSRSAEVLFERVIAEYPDSFVAPSAWENLGDTRRTKGDLIAAADCYREALRLGPSRHVRGSAGLSLAEVLIEMGGEEVSEEALQVLRDELPRLTFNSSRFRWETALAILSERLGEIETSKRAARRALDLIDAAPQFPRHGRDVGVATATPEQRDALLRLSDQ
ncbi:MAG TPA: tetratricopeptide repeat protein [Anaeromyxobacteraceae bacterium]|nr:tetratricopeptide repeat protein [Anaeromyxobacteraceae bacterium]